MSHGRSPWIPARTIAVGAAILVASLPAFCDPSDNRPFTAYVEEQFSYDDNLFRLPSQFSAASGISRQDHVNTIFAGGEGQWTLGRQAFGLKFRVDDSRFAQNSSLNYTAEFARFDWDWIISPYLMGDAGGDFSRSLASFSDTHFFQRDLIDTTGYFADAHVRVAQQWRINVGVRNADTTHSLAIRQKGDFRSKSGNVSLEYLTDEQNSIALDYHYTNATFLQPISIGGIPFNPNYNDRAERILVKYALTGKILLDASAGYLNRRYPDASFGSFSGNTWNASLKWQATGKTLIAFGAWRQLNAYLGSEADYFVSRGESIAPTWHATEKIDLSLSASWSNQHYLGSSPSALQYTSRRDTVRDQQVNLKYVPRDFLNLQLSYTLEQRNSNQAQFSYDDKLWTASFKFLF